MWNLLAMKTSPLLFRIKFIFKCVISARLIFELGTAPPRNTINLSARTGTLNLTGLVSQTNGSARKQRLKEVSRLLREVLNLMTYKRRRRPKVVPFSAGSPDLKIRGAGVGRSCVCGGGGGWESSRPLDKGEAVSKKSFFDPSGRKEYL